MYPKSLIASFAALVALVAPFAAQGQAIQEDFTGTTTANGWYFFNGACLTAGAANGVEPSGPSASGQIPGCTAIGSSYYGQNLVGGQNGVAGNTQTLPDPVGEGALRFTNGNPGGYSQNGGIVSTTPFSTGQGISVSFKTVTYRGDSGGAGGDGADGISFFLMDATQLNTSAITGVSSGNGNGLGAWGGSLGYSCSNANPPYNGLIGAYVAVGIDEYGNFLNGATLMPGYTGSNSATGDNTHVGYGYKPDRIGMRGAGNIAWNWLNANYPNVYPSTFTAATQNTAVTETCRNGVLWNALTNHAVDANNNSVSSANQVALPDYAAIPNAYVELPATFKIANESAMARPAATPILYQLKISQNGLLSLSYSYNGGALQQIINKQNITTSNGPLPANFLFGFAGSTGGSTNIHEILCFKADPATSASSSAGASQKQSAKLETGAQVYFAYYNPTDGWTGSVTASGLGFDAFGDVVVAPTANWDASCNLTGVGAASSCSSTGVAGPTPAQNPTSRQILTWSGTAGIPFEWANLTTAQQAAITAGDPTPVNGNRVAYLRGVRTNEINTSGVGLFRRRSSVLADIVDASPIWVGAPNLPYPATWTDRLNPTATMAENGGSAQTYPQYVTAEQTRENVVYAGANDGMMHGFRSGYYDVNNNFVPTGNDGQEVLAYVPGAVVMDIHSTTANVDFANAQYGHNFFVDATPGSGDLFYQGAWHTWLAGGLGAGGSALFILDVTNPTAANFSESNAASLVIGEWTPATISCANVSNCGNNLGNTYGTPLIRRMHDGKWAVIFGNGFGSTSGDAGIYVMTIDPTTAAKTVYYLSTATGSAASPNGIAFTQAADLDGDHISDYIYAGDLQGNVWRFDVTSNNEANWGLTPGPLFKTPAGQPITTALAGAAGSVNPGMMTQLMVMFGTGLKTPLTNTTPVSYATGTQGLYGVWDWNMSSWNSISSAQYAALTPVQTGLSTTNDYLQQANLQGQTITVDPTTQNRDITSPVTICWAGQPTCTGNAAKFGWYLNLPGTQEQTIFSPELVQQAFTVNTIVPAANSLLSCANLTDTGFTYLVNALTGGPFNQAFYPPGVAANPALNTSAQLLDANAAGIQTNATGTSVIIYNNSGVPTLVYQSVPGGTCPPGDVACTGTHATPTNLPANSTGRRVSWIQRR